MCLVLPKLNTSDISGMSGLLQKGEKKKIKIDLKAGIPIQICLKWS